VLGTEAAQQPMIYPHKIFSAVKNLLIASYYIQVPALTSCMQGIEFNCRNSNMWNKSARQEPTDQVECSYSGITGEQCKAHGCCWRPTNTEGALWYFNKSYVSVATPTTGLPCMLNISILLTRTLN